MLREKQIDTGAATLSYVSGAPMGPPLLLLHGVTSRWQTWLPVIPSFAVGYQIIAVDHRGHGRSSRVAGGYRILDYAADASALLRGQVEQQPAIVIGHSLGAIIGIALAADAPELVRALVLEDPPLGAFSDQPMRERQEASRFVRLRDLAAADLTPAQLMPLLAELDPSRDAAALRSWATAINQLDPDVLTMLLEGRAKVDYAMEQRLARITCPTLLLQGNPALGGALNDDEAGRAMALLADGLHVALPTLGHGLHAGDPLGFCRIVHDFLESL
jgi:pimeloyl-ACP methyl ester carboxylesterase